MNIADAKKWKNIDDIIGIADILKLRISISYRFWKKTDIDPSLQVSDEYMYLYKKPMISDDEAEKNDGTDADKWFQSVRIERLLQHHTQTNTHRPTVQCESKKPTRWGFLAFFPKWLGIFSPNFTRLLYVPIYARLQFFIQLSPTMTELCHIKCDHPASVSVDGGHFEHDVNWVVA